MSSYTVAQLDEIEELSDGRCPWRPVRHHLGITSFGVNAWTARAAGDRIINEHDESEPESDEELYLVLRGRATFELDGDQLDAPVGTLVFARPASSGLPLPRSPTRRSWRSAPSREKHTSLTAGKSGPPFTLSTRPASTPRWPTAPAR